MSSSMPLPPSAVIVPRKLWYRGCIQRSIACEKRGEYDSVLHYILRVFVDNIAYFQGSAIYEKPESGTGCFDTDEYPPLSGNYPVIPGRVIYKANRQTSSSAIKQLYNKTPFEIIGDILGQDKSGA